MHEAVVFWLLVAVVCGSFAAAEYMYLVEVFRICRSRTQSLPYKVLVVLVAIADGIVFLKDNAREIARTYHWRFALCDRNGKEWVI